MIEPVSEVGECSPERHTGTDIANDACEFARELAGTGVRDSANGVEHALAGSHAQGEELEHRRQLRGDAGRPTTSPSLQHPVPDDRGERSGEQRYRDADDRGEPVERRRQLCGRCADHESGRRPGELLAPEPLDGGRRAGLPEPLGDGLVAAQPIRDDPRARRATGPTTIPRTGLGSDERRASMARASGERSATYGATRSTRRGRPSRGNAALTSQSPRPRSTPSRSPNAPTAFNGTIDAPREGVPGRSSRGRRRA